MAAMLHLKKLFKEMIVQFHWFRRGYKPPPETVLIKLYITCLWHHEATMSQSVYEAIGHTTAFQLHEIRRYGVSLDEDKWGSIFSCDQAALWMVQSVCPSVCHTFLTLFPSSYHHNSNWIHIWWWNDAQSLRRHRRGALLFFKVIHQISRSHG